MGVDALAAHRSGVLVGGANIGDSRGSTNTASLNMLDSAGHTRWSLDIPGAWSVGAVAVGRNDSFFAVVQYRGAAELQGHGFDSGDVERCLLLKLSDSGTVDWIRDLLPSQGTFCRGATFSGANIFVIGSSLPIDGELPGSWDSAGDYDAFVVQFSEDGEWVSGRMFGSPGTEQGRALAINDAGELVLVGSFADAPWAPPNTEQSFRVGKLEHIGDSIPDGYVIHQHLAATPDWVYQFSSPGVNVAKSVVSLADRWFVSGSRQDEAPAPGTNWGTSDAPIFAYLLRLERNGTLSATFENRDMAAIDEIAATATGDLVLAGYYRDGLTLDLAGASQRFEADDLAAFIMVVDAELRPQRFWSCDGPGRDQVRSVATNGKFAYLAINAEDGNACAGDDASGPLAIVSRFRLDG